MIDIWWLYIVIWKHNIKNKHYIILFSQEVWFFCVDLR